MDLDELENCLEIVFEKELSDRRNSRVFYFKRSRSVDIFIYPNAETLIDLFSTIQGDEPLKQFFVNRLIKNIMSSEETTYRLASVGEVHVSLSPLCFYALLELGFANEAISALEKRQSGFNGNFQLILALVSENYFDEAQLKIILRKVRTAGGISYYANQLNSAIIKTRYKLLKKRIKTVNVEINQDKKTVSEKLSMFGFNENYSILLNEIDHFINTETSKAVNAGMISNLRTFMGNLMKDVANRIAEQKGERIPKLEDRGEMGNVREYLKRNLELPHNDDRFIDSFIDILHSEGGHSFISEKEYFRLARNIAIEIALFVLSKYEKRFRH